MSRYEWLMYVKNAKIDFPKITGKFDSFIELMKNIKEEEYLPSIKIVKSLDDGVLIMFWNYICKITLHPYVNNEGICFGGILVQRVDNYNTSYESIDKGEMFNFSITGVLSKLNKRIHDPDEFKYFLAKIVYNIIT